MIAYRTSNLGLRVRVPSELDAVSHARFPSQSGTGKGKGSSQEY